MIYPYSYPIILTDDIFQEYGGDVANTTYEMRQICYQLAEENVSNHLDTFLIPTIVTGTYRYRYGEITLDNCYVQNVFSVSIYDKTGNLLYSEDNLPQSFVANYNLGIIDISALPCGLYYNAKAVEVVYEAGLPTGVVQNPAILLALSEMTKIYINEILGYGNESTGDVGVQTFSNQMYSEVRVGLLRTDFGTSAKAQFVHRLLKPYKVHRFVGI